MIIHDVQQGTREWLDLRAGIPTASQFDLIITPGGEESKSQERYMLTLLAERIMNHPVTEHMSMWMERGSQMESDAVKFYEFQKDTETVPVGFITNDAQTIGASPDRLVGEDGLLEIKVPAEWTHMSYLLTTGGAYKAYKVQVQGQLWVTGRQWVDVLSFHPELPPALIRIERDESYIAKLEKFVTAFSVKLEEQFREVVARGWLKTEQERTESQLEASLRIIKETLVNRV